MSQLNEVVQKLMEEVRKLSCNKQPARVPSTSPEETLPQQQLPGPRSPAPPIPTPPTTSLAPFYNHPHPSPFSPRFLTHTSLLLITIRDCALHPTCFLTHHPHPEQHSLYDQVHIYRSEVPTFAKTLKDVALNRQPNTSHRTSRAMGIPPRPTSRGPPASRPPPRPRGPLTPKDPFPPDHITTSRPPTLTHPGATSPGPTPLLPTPHHTPWSHQPSPAQPRPTPLLPTHTHTPWSHQPSPAQPRPTPLLPTHFTPTPRL
ncbi:unnamed protein product [Arctogadus glacialis]